MEQVAPVDVFGETVEETRAAAGGAAKSRPAAPPTKPRTASVSDDSAKEVARLAKVSVKVWSRYLFVFCGLFDGDDFVFCGLFGGMPLQSCGPTHARNDPALRWDEEQSEELMQSAGKSKEAWTR